MAAERMFLARYEGPAEDATRNCLAVRQDLLNYGFQKAFHTGDSGVYTYQLERDKFRVTVSFDLSTQEPETHEATVYLKDSFNDISPYYEDMERMYEKHGFTLG